MFNLPLPFRRWVCLPACLAALASIASAAGPALELNLQKRVEARPGSGEFRVTTSAANRRNLTGVSS